MPSVLKKSPIRPFGMTSGPVAGFLNAGFGRTTVFSVWIRNYRTRKQLLLLTDAELRDIGKSPAQARAEAAKPFWEV